MTQDQKNNMQVGNISQSNNVNVAGGDLHVGFTAEQVSGLIAQISTNFQVKSFDGTSPYMGLKPFEESDAELFYGRTRLVNELIRRVKESRTVFITGASGSGKSSLVRAGLVAALKRGGIKKSKSSEWIYATMKPGREPLKALSTALSRLKMDIGDYFSKNTTAPDVLHKCAEALLSDSSTQRFVLLIDQFEEIFTQVNNEEERVAFLNLLTHAAEVENGRVLILLTMRSDFVPNCAKYENLNDLLNRQFIQIGAMQTHELVSAIALPAMQVGLKIEPELIAQIINDMKGEPGALPLMQFALKDLFDAEQEKGRLTSLNLKDYLERGGIQDALNRHADKTFNELDEREKELARSIFSGLIEIGRGTQDTKRTAHFEELVPTQADKTSVDAILQKLANARLVTLDKDKDSVTVTLAHEKLLSAWTWLRKLVDENRDVIAVQNEIIDDVKEWEENKRDASYLYSGGRLATAKEKIKDLTLSESAQFFLNTSIKIETEARQKSRRVQRRILTGSLTFSAVVLGLLILALTQLNISRAQQLGSQAQVAFSKQNYNTALLYAYQSNLIHENSAANTILGQVASINFFTGKGLLGHTYKVTSVAWSADGQLASGSEDDKVILWDLKTGQPAQTLIGHTYKVTSVAWSADGQLASGSEDGTVIIWNLKTGKPAQTLIGHKDSVSSVAWSADGQLASGSADGTVIIWDLITGKPSQTLTGHTDWVSSVAWSADGQLASGSEDGTVILWDLKTGQPVQTLTGHSAWIKSVAWSADGQMASGSADGTVILWDLVTGKPAQTLISTTETVDSVAWSTDGRLASGSDDGNVIIWDLIKGKPAQTLIGHTGWVNSVAWSTDGQLASGSTDQTIMLWDLKIEQPAQTLTGHIYTVTSVAWSTDGRLASGSEDDTVIIWDLNTGMPAQTLIGHKDSVSSVAWSADGQLASGSVDGTVIIWDLITGKPSQTLTGHTDWVSSVAWSADGRLASGSGDGTVIIWDLITGKPAQTLIGDTKPINNVAWSADGQLTSGSDDNDIIIWDLITGQPAQTLIGHTAWIKSVAWSADGQLASGSGDGTIIIWDLITGKPAQTLIGDTESINSVAWSTDGRLASGSVDGTVIIWNLITGKPAQTLKEHTDWVNSVAWSADGRLASGASDRKIKIARADMLIAPCNRIFRNMSLPEWENTQGYFYIYKPACSNLYDPSNISIFDDINLIPITWEGHILILTLVVILIIIPALIFWIILKTIKWIWQKVRSRRATV